MKTRMISAVMAAFMLATASIGGITASAEVGTAETAETTASEPADESSDDMEKFREVMSELAETDTTDVVPDYDGDSYYDTDGNATLIKSERIIYNTEEMQFIAVTTKDGHVFYVLINYTADNGEDNVYFLNKVDDYDLYALLMPELRRMMPRRSLPSRQLKKQKRRTAEYSPAAVIILTMLKIPLRTARNRLSQQLIQRMFL